VLAPENGPQRRVAAVVVTNRLGHAHDRFALLAIAIGALRYQRLGKRVLGENRTATKSKDSRGVIDIQDLARTPSR
jgi:hypothetical protein